MMLFRPAEERDLDDLYQLALAGGIGLTTLAKNKQQLAHRIEKSIKSFFQAIKHPQDENYLFVLEDPKTKRVVGVSGIESSVGFDVPFYSYKVSRKTRLSHELGIRSDYETLSLVNDHQGLSEICSLFLDKAYRVRGNGLLLSKGRFLYMANAPKRFASILIAEMRGVSDKKGNSPFWDNVGCHFFKMRFPEADHLTSSTNKQFIADLMPTTPIHVCLLSKDAQTVIGKPHHSTLPAMKILLREGFRYTGYVDIFDAGPTLESPLNQIKTIRDSLVCIVTDVIDEVNDENYFIANTKTLFRASIGNIMLDKKNLTCIISQELAKLLHVTLGDALRVCAL